MPTSRTEIADGIAVATAVKYCDVVGYNLYRDSVANFRMPVEADKPVIIGEFHFGALDLALFQQCSHTVDHAAGASVMGAARRSLRRAIRSRVLLPKTPSAVMS